ncbi:hypothetical protein [Pseudonocardia sp. GCM10023141]|uniref:hypothetical protein n=1 Tax=Pseudonocardia sp. GCM10023141 TaxID=3252653 RepID=UPI00360D2328
MKLQTYADVVNSENPSRTAAAGTANPGELLEDVLRRSEGRYEVSIVLSDRVRDELRKMSEITSDSKLATTANQSEVKVSLEHLRQYDPGSTRIVYGFTIEREPGDAGLENFGR